MQGPCGESHAEKRESYSTISNEIERQWGPAAAGSSDAPLPRSRTLSLEGAASPDPPSGGLLARSHSACVQPPPPGLARGRSHLALLEAARARGPAGHTSVDIRLALAAGAAECGVSPGDLLAADGHAALRVAAVSGSEEAFDAIMTSYPTDALRAEALAADHYIVLRLAAAFGNVPILQRVLATCRILGGGGMLGAALAAEGHDALATAVQHGHLDAVQVLVLSAPSREQRGAALRDRGATQQRTPLQWAAWVEGLEAFRFLLE